MHIYSRILCGLSVVAEWWLFCRWHWLLHASRRASSWLAKADGKFTTWWWPGIPGCHSHVHLVYRTSASVKGTDVYPHMPIPRNGASPAWSLRWRISTVMFTSWWAWPARWPISLILGFWWCKVYKNLWFPALDANEPLSQMWRR